MKKHMSLNTFLMILFTLIVIGGGIAGTEIEMARKRDRIWFESYPMTNQRISWEGAGYNGIYGGNR